MKAPTTTSELEFLQALIEHIHDIILVENLNHEFVFSNQYTADLFGYETPEAMMGINAHSMKCPASSSAEEFIKQDKLVIERSKPIELLDIHQYADGHSRVLLTRKSPIFDDDIVRYTLCHCREISSDILQKIALKLNHHDKRLSKCATGTYRVIHTDDLFSKREISILFYLLRGKTATQISEVLFISKRTVENHIANMKQKISVSKKSQLIEYGLSHGYLNTIPEHTIKTNLSSYLKV